MAQPLASFSSLPSELRCIIPELACFNECYDLCLEANVAQTLRLVSRDVSSMATPIFFRTVMLDRPSELCSFLRLLQEQPALGLLVRTLHLGPAWHLPHDWWPLKFLADGFDVDLDHIATSLGDEEVLPRWCRPRRTWSVFALNPGDVLNPRAKAVLRALETAQKSLGLDLAMPATVPDGPKDDQLQWLIGVMEVQAALDLYLLEMRRLEDAAGVSVPKYDGKAFGTAGPKQQGPSIAYPSLRLTDDSAAVARTTSSVPKVAQRNSGRTDSFIVSRAMLQEHLSRSGGPGDYFDHPLIFARSGLQVYDFDEFGQGRRNCELLSQMAALADAGFTRNDAASPPAGGEAAEPVSPSTPPLPNGAAPATSTIGDILALARALIALTPRLQSLFLTGALQAVVCHGPAPSLPSLRSLCLGPLALNSDESLAPSPLLAKQLAHLQELKFMGCGLADRKLACMNAFPGLKKVEWAMESSLEPATNVIQSLRPLINPAAFAPQQTTTRRVTRKRTRGCYESVDSEDELSNSESEAEEPEASTARRQPPRILAAISGESLEVLEKLFTPKAKAARDAGRSLSRRPRQFVLWGVYRDSLEEERWDGAEPKVSVAYDVVREWWEECLTGRSRWSDENDIS